MSDDNNQYLTRDEFQKYRHLIADQFELMLTEIKRLQHDNEKLLAMVRESIDGEREALNVMKENCNQLQDGFNRLHSMFGGDPPDAPPRIN